MTLYKIYSEYYYGTVEVFDYWVTFRGVAIRRIPYKGSRCWCVNSSHVNQPHAFNFPYKGRIPTAIKKYIKSNRWLLDLNLSEWVPINEFQF